MLDSKPQKFETLESESDEPWRRGEIEMREKPQGLEKEKDKRGDELFILAGSSTWSAREIFK